MLTEKQRNALLAELAGLPTGEIARRYQTTNGAVYKLTYDARKALVPCFISSVRTDTIFLRQRPRAIIIRPFTI